MFYKAADGSYQPYDVVTVTVTVDEDWTAIRTAAQSTLQALTLPTKPAQQRQAQVLQALQNLALPTLTPPTPPTLWSQQIQSLLKALDDLAFLRQEVLQATPLDTATLAAIDRVRLDLDSLLLLYEALSARVP